MDILRIGEWTVKVDSATTSGWYRSRETFAETCGCIHCRNFVQAVKLIPTEVNAVLSMLGIDPTKEEGEIWYNCKLDDGRRSYGAFYHVVGSLVEGMDCKVETSTGGFRNQLNPIDKDEVAAIGFTNDLSLVSEGFPHPILQVEMTFCLSWELDELPEDDY